MKSSVTSWLMQVSAAEAFIKSVVGKPGLFFSPPSKKLKWSLMRFGVFLTGRLLWWSLIYLTSYRLVHQPFHKSSLSPLLWTSPSPPTFDNSSPQCSSLLPDGWEIALICSEICSEIEQIWQKAAHTGSIIWLKNTNLNRFFCSIYAIWEKLFCENFRILVASVHCVRLECGQFPSMKIHLIYDLRYHLTNLFLWFMI